jgi:hypothetical protein
MNTTKKSRLVLNVVVWTIILLMLAVPAFFMWRELSEGHIFKVLIISAIAGLGGWRAYKAARTAARS